MHSAQLIELRDASIGILGLFELIEQSTRQEVFRISDPGDGHELVIKIASHVNACVGYLSEFSGNLQTLNLILNIDAIQTIVDACTERKVHMPSELPIRHSSIFEFCLWIAEGFKNSLFRGIHHRIRFGSFQELISELERLAQSNPLELVWLLKTIHQTLDRLNVLSKSELIKTQVLRETAAVRLYCGFAKGHDRDAPPSTDIPRSTGPKTLRRPSLANRSAFYALLGLEVYLNEHYKDAEDKDLTHNQRRDLLAAVIDKFDRAELQIASDWEVPATGRILAESARKYDRWIMAGNPDIV
ncbi:hypothetical protein [Neorhodopirellula pilleata]|uniref:hypothetical protein n=1 Tax=Neorhodopirellula pilleata TaxID=2714738 RepID=UPI001E2D9C46|nr:hypothetical protein [Neorhodopirellula pilleata]